MVEGIGAVWAAVVAAGEGRRMRGPAGAAGPRKPFLRVGGRAILARTVEAVARCADVAGIVVAVAADDLDGARALVTASSGGEKIRAVIAGGPRRQDTVAIALRAMPDDVEFAAVHDGARPFAGAALFSRAIDAARRTGAACVASPCHETIKRVDALGVVRGTVDRTGLWSAQTPQVFRRRQLLEFLDEAARDGVEVTDETALFDMRGLAVEAVVGERANIKITTPDDLMLAEAIAAGGRAVENDLSVGTGYDAHRLVPGRRLVVCGVELDSPVGAEGHSDADAGAHAVIDALLGASALGDIGRLFPDTDRAYRDADSMGLLAQVRDRLRAHGVTVLSIDVTVFLGRPKLAPHAAEMARRVAEAAGAPHDRVSVKAKTMNGIGPVGEGAAVAAQAVALVTRGAGATGA